MESTGPDGPNQPKRGKSRAGGKGRKGGKRTPVVRSHPVLIFMDPIPWRALKRRSPAQLQTMMLDQLTTRQQARLTEARAAEAAAAAQLFPPPSPPVEVPAGPEPEPAPSAAAFHLSQDCLDAAHSAERAIAQAAAVRARQLDAARTHAQQAVMLGEDPTGPTDATDAAGEAFGKKVPKWTRSEIAFRGFTAMVAAELHITEAAAEKLITTSTTLIHTFPTMLALLEKGNTTWRHVESLVAHSYRVPEEHKTAYEAALVGAAQEMTPSQFDRTARREADTYVDDALEVRHREAMTHRSLTLTPSEDGMADLHLHIDACDAVAIYNRATDIARGLKTPTDGRTLDLIRTDVATRLMREGITTTPGAPAPGEAVSDPTSVGAGGGKGLGVGIVATVALQVPVLRLLDDINAEESPDAEPTQGGPGADTAELVGYGPISMDRARELMGTATSFTRILTHPETGTILSIGRKRYRVPAAMRLFLMVRDQTCRFPGCTVLARFCDIDHTTDWDDGGPTDTTNLAHVCEAHHRLKHQTGWTYTQDDNGVCTWVSPTGKTYVTRPAKNITPPAAETLVPTTSIWDYTDVDTEPATDRVDDADGGRDCETNPAPPGTPF